jgi:hypothetical protein
MACVKCGRRYGVSYSICPSVERQGAGHTSKFKTPHEAFLSMIDSICTSMEVGELEIGLKRLLCHHLLMPFTCIHYR